MARARVHPTPHEKIAPAVLVRLAKRACLERQIRGHPATNGDIAGGICQSSIVAVGECIDVQLYGFIAPKLTQHNRAERALSR